GEGYRRRDMLRLVADVTDLLGRAREGEADAKAALIARVYSELRALAASYFRGRPGQTLQPTALVHEAYVRLPRAHASQRKDRLHFMAVAATAMRQILTDKARRRSAGKRGGPNKERVTLSNLPALDSPVDVLALDELLGKLALLDERQARLVELRFFAGLTAEGTATALGVSLRPVPQSFPTT